MEFIKREECLGFIGVKDKSSLPTRWKTQGVRESSSCYRETRYALGPMVDLCLKGHLSSLSLDLAIAGFSVKGIVSKI